MSQLDRLTFAEFQATGRDVADLREVHPDFDDRAYYPEPIPARVYAANQLYLQPNPDAGKDGQGPWFCEIGNFCVTGELATVEAELYAFYVCECAADEVRDALIAAAPANTYLGA